MIMWGVLRHTPALSGMAKQPLSLLQDMLQRACTTQVMLPKPGQWQRSSSLPPHGKLRHLAVLYHECYSMSSVFQRSHSFGMLRAMIVAQCLYPSQAHSAESMHLILIIPWFPGGWSSTAGNFSACICVGVGEGSTPGHIAVANQLRQDERQARDMRHSQRCPQLRRFHSTLHLVTSRVMTLRSADTFPQQYAVIARARAIITPHLGCLVSRPRCACMQKPNLSLLTGHTPGPAAPAGARGGRRAWRSGCRRTPARPTPPSSMSDSATAPAPAASSALLRTSAD